MLIIIANNDITDISSIVDAMRNLIEWYKNDNETHAIIKSAIFSYEFVSIHPFQDGNKRTAAVVCETFLLLNGYELTATEEEAYKIFLSLAEGDFSAEQMAEWIRNTSTKAE